MASIGDIFLKLFADDSGFAADVERKAGAAGAKGGQSASQKMGAAMKRGTERALIGAGAAVGVFVAGSVQEFAKFEEQMNEVFTLLPGITKDAMDQMSDDVKAFSNETGKLPDEVIPALYQAISAGVPQDNVFEFLRVANKAAVAGVATTSDSVNLLAAVTKGYGDTSQEAVAKVADLAFETVKLGQTTYPELAASIGKVVPLAAALGVTQEELFGITASLTGVTGNTAEVMTQQKAALTALVKQTPEMSKAIKTMGFETAQSAIETLGLTGTLNGLIGTTDGTTEALSGMFGTTEAVTAVLALTGAQSEVAAEKISAMGEATGSVDAAFATMESGIGARTRKIAANLRTFAIGVGEELKDLGPLFVLFGPTAGRAIGAGLGGAFGFVVPKLAGLGKKIGLRLAGAIAAQIGSRAVGNVMADGLSEGLNTAGASPKVAGATTKLGKFLGSRLGTALSLAFAAAAIAGVIETYNRLNNEIKQQGEELAATTAEFVKTATVEQLKAAREAAVRGFEQNSGFGMFDNIFGQKDILIQQVKDLDAAIAAAAGEIPANAGAAIAAGGPAVSAGVRQAMSTASKDDSAAETWGKRLARTVVKAFYDGVIERQSVVGGALAELITLQENTMDKAQEIAYLTGVLISDELAAGLNDKRDNVRAQAEETRRLAEERLAKLAPNAGNIGKDVNKKLAAGMKSEDPNVVNQTKRTAALIEKHIQANTRPAGVKAGKDVVSGLNSQRGAIARAAFNIGNLIYRRLITGLTTAAGGKTTGGGGIRRAHGGPVYAGQPTVVGEKRAELFVPEVSGHVYPTIQSGLDAIGSTGGGDTIINVPVQGLMPVRSPRDIVTELIRVRDVRLLPGKRVAPMYPRPIGE